MALLLPELPYLYIWLGRLAINRGFEQHYKELAEENPFSTGTLYLYQYLSLKKEILKKVGLI